MFKNIMVPVDLENRDEIKRAVETAADLAKHYGAQVTFVGVTSSAPGAAASPHAFEKALDEYAAGIAGRHGIATAAKSVVCHDPAVELDDSLRRACRELGSDLIVMASHHPGIMEHLISSNAGYLASHADVSVFVVR